MNRIVWRNLGDSARDLDVKFGNIQSAICNAGSVMAQMLYDLNAVNEDEPSEFSNRLLDTGMKALGFWAHVNANLNFRRREVMRSQIDLGHLCSTDVKFTDQWF